MEKTQIFLESYDFMMSFWLFVFLFVFFVFKSSLMLNISLNITLLTFFKPAMAHKFCCKTDLRVFSHLWCLVCLNRGCVNMVITAKQPHRDPLEEVVTVRFQMNSRAVRLWWERDPNLNQLPGLRYKSELKNVP